jgi:hypothetical protein
MARELQRRKNIIITWNHHAVDKCSSKKGTGTDILPKIEDQATNDQTDDGTSISAGYYMFVDSGHLLLSPLVTMLHKPFDLYLYNGVTSVLVFAAFSTIPCPMPIAMQAMQL